MGRVDCASGGVGQRRIGDCVYGVADGDRQMNTKLRNFLDNEIPNRVKRIKYEIFYYMALGMVLLVMCSYGAVMLLIIGKIFQW